MYAVKGKRAYQEDCGSVIELGDILVLAIADGFNKPQQSGSIVSQHVLTETLFCISTQPRRLRKDPEEFLKETFGRIREKTKQYVAGSTLSLVIINKIDLAVTLAVVGDSIVVVTDSNNDMHIHPLELLRSRHKGLATAFGNRSHSSYSLSDPFITSHKLNRESVVIVSSDGLYPVTPEDNIKEIKTLAEHYVHTIHAGGTPQDLVNYASVNQKSPDNITAAFYKAEFTIS